MGVVKDQERTSDKNADAFNWLDRQLNIFELIDRASLKMPSLKMPVGLVQMRGHNLFFIFSPHP
jgi:hypothetical protein